eukprot:CAMPEP_0172539744 /NCGR_PEP_ID=MMETSP1067-20121228/10884_1 /TAXON_ID=265564 ORGANISM="Thalassiosira punctigera, Strain Tpunct2005C2" /NCGR_SAMPLE_ID=MMETSP1067 /ASSEMBLY_ACC=CAM_ASM_000444 /LENGTH=171 /DNA_ID=CAMNT_0013325473 /DNA_START=52 /DNA_END=567 /DNA_ORIENTATION=-
MKRSSPAVAIAAVAISVIGTASSSATYDSPCSSKEACDARRTQLDISNFYDYSTNDAATPASGCFTKNDKAFWKPGSAEEEGVEDLPGILVRIWCEAVVEEEEVEVEEESDENNSRDAGGMQFVDDGEGEAKDSLLPAAGAAENSGNAPGAFSFRKGVAAAVLALAASHIF